MAELDKTLAGDDEGEPDIQGALKTQGSTPDLDVFCSRRRLLAQDMEYASRTAEVLKDAMQRDQEASA